MRFLYWICKLRPPKHRNRKKSKKWAIRGSNSPVPFESERKRGSKNKVSTIFEQQRPWTKFHRGRGSKWKFFINFLFKIETQYVRMWNLWTKTSNRLIRAFSNQLLWKRSNWTFVCKQVPFSNRGVVCERGSCYAAWCQIAKFKIIQLTKNVKPCICLFSLPKNFVMSLSSFSFLIEKGEKEQSPENSSRVCFKLVSQISSISQVLDKDLTTRKDEHFDWKIM